MTPNEEDTNSTKIVSFEDLMDLVGTKGWRNYLIFLLASITCLITPLPVFSYQFLGFTPPHWCHVQELVSSNWTAEQIKDIAIPYTESNGKRVYSECEKYFLNYAELSTKPYEEVEEEVKSNKIKRNKTVECSSRDFEDHVETIVNKWDLVCERRALYSTTQAAIYGGTLVGSLVGGYFIDRFGRKFMFKICAFLYIIFGFVTSISPNVFVFIALRFCISITGSGVYMPSFVLCMEMCSRNQRSLVGSYFAIPWSLGMMLTAGIAYLVRPWNLLQVALTIPSLLLLLNVWILPESPRWLILKGRHKEALEILKGIAKSNDKELPSDQQLLQHMENIKKMNVGVEETTEKESVGKKIMTILTDISYVMLEPKLRFQTLGIFFCWFSVALVYYGISLGSVAFSTNNYLYIFLSGVVEIPSYLLLWPAVVLLGRRRVVNLSFFTCAISILSVMALVLADKREDYSTLRLILSLGGKFAITACFQLIWIYTAELYPTEYRSLIVGQSSATARIGSICSPYINDLMGKVSTWSPAALFGVLSILAGIVSFSFPETSGKILPDSVDKLPESDLQRKK